MHAAYLRMVSAPHANAAHPHGGQQLVAVREKYAHPRFEGVASIPPRLL
jgi:hypothetical protein